MFHNNGLHVDQRIHIQETFFLSTCWHWILKTNAIVKWVTETADKSTTLNMQSVLFHINSAIIWWHSFVIVCEVLYMRYKFNTVMFYITQWLAQQLLLLNIHHAAVMVPWHLTSDFFFFRLSRPPHSQFVINFLLGLKESFKGLELDRRVNE